MPPEERTMFSRTPRNERNADRARREAIEDMVGAVLVFAIPAMIAAICIMLGY